MLFCGTQREGKGTRQLEELKPKVKIKDLLSRDSAEDKCRDEKRKQAKNVKQSKGEG